MADVKEQDMPESVMDELRRVVTQHCLLLHVVMKLAGTPERGKKVADFMKDRIGELLDFNMIERTLILKFLNESEAAVNKAMEEAGVMKPMSELQPQLDELIEQGTKLANFAWGAAAAKKGDN